MSRQGLVTYLCAGRATSLCKLPCCWSQELLAQLEAASMSQKLSSTSDASNPEKLDGWRQQIQQYEEFAGGINQQEAQLGCKQTQYADLDEVKRVLQESINSVVKGL